MKKAARYLTVLVVILIPVLICGPARAATAQRNLTVKQALEEAEKNVAEGRAAIENSKKLAAAAQGTAVLNIEQCLKEADKRAWSLKLADEDVVQGKEKVWQATTSFLPSVSTSYTYRRSEPLKTINTSLGAFTTGELNNYSWSVSVSQPVFTGFSLIAKKRIADLGLDVNVIAREQAEIDLALKVKQAYFNLLLTQKGLLVEQEAVKLLINQVNVAKNFYEVGMIPKNDLLQAEVDLAERRQSLTNALNAVMLAKATLNTALRRDINTPLAIEDVMGDTPPPPPFDLSLKKALDLRPEIRQADKAISIAEQSVTAARSGFYPSISLSLSYGRESAGMDVWNSDGELGNRESTTITAGASWSLWTWGSTRSEVATARSSLLKSKITVKQLKDSVALEIKQNLLSLSAARDNISVASLAVRQAEENFRISEERYKEQVTTSTEVLDARIRLTTAQRNYYAALYNYHLAMAGLKRAMGEK